MVCLPLARRDLHDAPNVTRGESSLASYVADETIDLSLGVVARAKHASQLLGLG
jgi:hypothetical protein